MQDGGSHHLKNRKIAIYLSNGLTDRHEILHDDEFDRPDPSGR